MTSRDQMHSSFIFGQVESIHASLQVITRLLIHNIYNHCIVFSCKYFSWVSSTHEIFLLSNISQTTVSVVILKDTFHFYCTFKATVIISVHIR